MHMQSADVKPVTSNHRGAPETTFQVNSDSCCAKYCLHSTWLSYLVAVAYRTCAVSRRTADGGELTAPAPTCTLHDRSGRKVAAWRNWENNCRRISGRCHFHVDLQRMCSARCGGVARHLLSGTKDGIWGRKSPSGVQGGVPVSAEAE